MPAFLDADPDELLGMMDGGAGALEKPGRRKVQCYIAYVQTFEPQPTWLCRPSCPSTTSASAGPLAEPGADHGAPPGEPDPDRAGAPPHVPGLVR